MHDQHAQLPMSWKLFEILHILSLPSHSYSQQNCLTCLTCLACLTPIYLYLPSLLFLPRLTLTGWLISWTRSQCLLQWDNTTHKHPPRSQLATVLTLCRLLCWCWCRPASGVTASLHISLRICIQMISIIFSLSATLPNSRDITAIAPFFYSYDSISGEGLSKRMLNIRERVSCC